MNDVEIINGCMECLDGLVESAWGLFDGRNVEEQGQRSSDVLSSNFVLCVAREKMVYDAPGQFVLLVFAKGKGVVHENVVRFLGARSDISNTAPVASLYCGPNAAGWT